MSETDTATAQPNEPLDAAIAERQQQLDERERELVAREARLTHLQRAWHHDNRDPLVLRVGQHVFHTTPAILCGKGGQDSFFRGLLNPHIGRTRSSLPREPEKGESYGCGAGAWLFGGKRRQT